MTQEPLVIQGSSFSDERGILKFVNELHFEGVKRFYIITHSDVNVVRAWQGHKQEAKYFYVIKGSFNVNWIEIDNWENPSKDLKINKIVLQEGDNKLLVIPAGYANGFRALEPDSSLLVFSNLALEESVKDNYRFSKNYWNLI